MWPINIRASSVDASGEALSKNVITLFETISKEIIWQKKIIGSVGNIITFITKKKINTKFYSNCLRLTLSLQNDLLYRLLYFDVLVLAG